MNIVQLMYDKECFGSYEVAIAVTIGLVNL